MDYRPDRWLVVKLTNSDNNSHYRVFACWSGGYLDGDSWKLNSGITKVTLVDDCYEFEGSSGSLYRCHVNAQGITGYGSGVLSSLIENSKDKGITIEILPETTDYLELEVS